MADNGTHLANSVDPTGQYLACRSSSPAPSSTRSFSFSREAHPVGSTRRFPSERTTEDKANIEEPTKYQSDIAFQTRLSLPQQLTPRDAATSWGRSNRSPTTYVQPSRSAGPGGRETTVTAGNTRMSSIPKLITPPRNPAALPAVRPVRMHTTLSPCSLFTRKSRTVISCAVQ